MDGVAYEHYCADLFRSAGWSVEHTKGSGDQGADLLVRKSGKSVAVQCKRYTGRIGNSAVQEVIAAQRFYQTSHAAVVSNNPYTKAAQQLALSSRIVLLHHDQIEGFWPEP
jgi:restriction system protein